MWNFFKEKLKGKEEVGRKGSECEELEHRTNREQNRTTTQEQWVPRHKNMTDEHKEDIGLLLGGGKLGGKEKSKITFFKK